tara:strand:- start:672 stop:899 length:228 start_codon:yes stop_codon:yes gene_type:complete
MRRSWFDYVAKIRKKGNRGKNTMTHAQAMKVAAETWPKEKKRLERKLKAAHRISGPNKESKKEAKKPLNDQNDKA